MVKTESVTEVTFFSDVKLSGTLVDAGKICVLLIPGSGMQDRDETFGSNKTFKEIADYLADNGISSLRYDKRGSHKSEGDFKKAGIDDFTKDAEAGMKFLQEKFDKVILLGHSEGGICAVKLANKSSGIILFASMNETMEEGIQRQLRLIDNVFSGMTKQMWEEYHKWKKDIENGVYKTYEDYYADGSELAQWIKDANKKNPQSPQYWNSLRDVDIRKDIKKVKVPMLVMNGKNDFLVDHEVTKKMVEGVKCELRIYDGLCHRFVRVKDVREGFEIDMGLKNKEVEINPKVLKDITDWIRNTVLKG